MSWSSIFKRKPGHADASSASTMPVDGVMQARVRARRRLIGAIVLVAIGVIGFPLIFESQPRPLPIDIPIEIPRKDQAPPLAMPASRPRVASASEPVVAERTESAPEAVAPTPAVVTETRAEAGRELPPPAAASAPKPAARTPAVAAAASTPAATRTPDSEAARAQALLEGKGGRFIVQAGAFADADSAQQTRARLEKLGLKTYTQVADTTAGRRTRVRLGPFASRAEADQALAKARGAGIAAVVLAL